MVERLAFTVRGTVQGVGFRPFVHRLADRHQLSGWVRNAAGPVEIEVEGEATSLRDFRFDLTALAPALARILSVEERHLAARGERGFRILESTGRAGAPQFVPPDTATCADCLRELFDPANRRYRHPFINCTACGPRFTVITSLPYDRPATTMSGFPMCPDCLREYGDPADRRFHAQPICCWSCGPRLSLTLEEAVAGLRAGRVLALKGLGGYQLACDARDESVVARLRDRKRRPSKPLAVMVSSLAELGQVGALEQAALEGPARPIVLIADPGLGLAPSVAPGLREVGVMLPYTPLHHLLLEGFGGPLVMTSGNLSEEPICRDDAEARERLAGIADLFLAHDRPIAARYDDSVVRVAGGSIRVLRRARGLAPEPLGFPAGPPSLATGGQLKAAFTLTRDGHAFVGPHVGDLEQVLSRQAFESGLDTYLRLFDVAPRVVACDLHPDFASTELAERFGEPVRVQHHHAHIASVAAEHGLTGVVVGAALDGVGLGTDGTAWGGEVLVCTGAAYERVAHLEPVGLPGGDLCAREGWRMAAAYGLESAPAGVDGRRFDAVRRLVGSGRVPMTTTSAGRLFDAVASLLGVCQVSTYEGEAAVLLEAIAKSGPVGDLGFALSQNRELFDALRGHLAAGTGAARLAAVFHDTLAGALVRECARAARAAGTDLVALSGGCFQNRRLLESCLDGLRAAGLRGYANQQVPANDGGLSLGQAWVAACR